MIITQKMLSLARKKWTLYNGNNKARFEREFIGIFESRADFEQAPPGRPDAVYFLDVEDKVAVFRRTGDFPAKL